MITEKLKAPFPWFGGKSSVAAEVWARFGEVQNLVDAFFGSGAILLGRPLPFNGPETVNDINAWLTNFWRATSADSDAVARYADWPVSELDLHARGDWLFYREGVDEWVEKVRSDPEFYDAKSAGWWAWGQSCWIGSGWGRAASSGRGVNRKRPHLTTAGCGVCRQIPSLKYGPQGIESRRDYLLGYLDALKNRLRKVRICCGDWSRVIGPSVTTLHGLTAVFLDPPYSVQDRDDCYSDDSRTVAIEAREWAIEHGNNPLFRIALCGYEGEHKMPSDWSVFAWKTRGGIGNQGNGQGRKNKILERIWFSPHCVHDGLLF